MTRRRRRGVHTLTFRDGTTVEFDGQEWRGDRFRVTVAKALTIAFNRKLRGDYYPDLGRALAEYVAEELGATISPYEPEPTDDPPDTIY